MNLEKLLKAANERKESLSSNGIKSTNMLIFTINSLNELDEQKKYYIEAQSAILSALKAEIIEKKSGFKAF